jgi:hypothetical protein
MDKNMERKLVIICGLPSSGNRIIGKCLAAGGQIRYWVVHGTKYPGIEVRMPTKNTKEERRSEMQIQVMKPDFAIIPVRDFHCQRISSKKNHSWVKEKEADLQQRVIAKLVECDTPFRLISYEGFCARPFHHIGELCKWMGVRPPNNIPNIEDGNAKYASTLL